MSTSCSRLPLDEHDDGVVAELLPELLGGAVGRGIAVDELVGAGVGLQAQRRNRPDQGHHRHPGDHRDRPPDAPARDPCEAIGHRRENSREPRPGGRAGRAGQGSRERGVLGYASDR